MNNIKDKNRELPSSCELENGDKSCDIQNHSKMKSAEDENLNSSKNQDDSFANPKDIDSAESTDIGRDIITRDDYDALANENRELRAKLLLTSNGADPNQIDTLIRLWDEPRFPENASPDQIAKIRAEYAESLREKYPWGFESHTTGQPVETDSRRIVADRSVKTSIAKQDAFSRGDIQAMLAMNRGKRR